MKNKPEHESAHAVFAIKKNLRFRKINCPFLNPETGENFSGTIEGFSPNLPLHEFNLSLVAGCLAEVYPEWLNEVEKFEKQAEQIPMLRPLKAKIPTPVDRAIKTFNPNDYPEDWKAYTRCQEFDAARYRQDLEEALPLLVDWWDDIVMLSSRMSHCTEISWEEAVSILQGPADETDGEGLRFPDTKTL